MLFKCEFYHSALQKHKAILMKAQKNLSFLPIKIFFFNLISSLHLRESFCDTIWLPMELGVKVLGQDEQTENMKRKKSPSPQPAEIKNSNTTISALRPLSPFQAENVQFSRHPNRNPLCNFNGSWFFTLSDISLSNSPAKRERKL